jgi:hypothetical protein
MWRDGSLNNSRVLYILYSLYSCGKSPCETCNLQGVFLHLEWNVTAEEPLLRPQKERQHVLFIERQERSVTKTRVEQKVPVASDWSEPAMTQFFQVLSF